MALADFTQQVFHRNLAVVEDQRAGRRSADAHLVFFRADRKSGEGFFDQKRAELFAIHFSEHGKEVGKAGVGDPHLFAVEDVVLAVGRELGASAAVQRV